MTHNESVVVGLCADKKELTPPGPFCLQIRIWSLAENKEEKTAKPLPPAVTLFLFPSLTCLDQP